ncbi:hypothetical protein B0H14DRAFT_3427727 [Mycena olivaceomarginata]|nr:hypothetical protein B0H14DRAFT_3427727 [Mycena olivaceomarginata]
MEQSKKIRLDDKDLLSFNPLWNPSLQSEMSPATSTNVFIAEPNSAPPDTPAAETAPSAATRATPLEILSDISHTAAVFPVTVTQEPVAPALMKAEVHFPPAVPNTTSKGPAPPAPSQSTAITQGRIPPGKMTTTNSHTPWYIHTLQGTRAQFGQYWDGLANTPGEKYWNTVSASTKANAAANAVVALA